MKLYVLGESTPEPSEWSIWSELALVVAESEQQALELGEGVYSIATEIKLDKPMVLIRMPEPNFGDDI